MIYLLKVLFTSVLVVAVAELAKRNSLAAAILASIPLVSVLAMIWLYIDTRDIERISKLASGVFWLVLPSLALFALLPVMLKAGWSFYLSLAAATCATVICYLMLLWLLSLCGIRL